MNNKQKSIITIYVIVAILSFCWAVYEINAVAAGGWVIMNGHEVAINSISNGYTDMWLGCLVLYGIGLIILGIPTYILYKVWADKK